MEVKIEVSDEQFQEIIKKSISSLPEEKIHELLLASMKEYLTQKNVWEALLVNSGSYSYSGKTPTIFLQELMQKAETTEAVNDIRDEMLGLLKENGRNILTEAFMKMFLDSIFKTKEFNSYASMSAYNAISQHISQAHSN